MGQWLSSNEGRDAFNECLGIVVRGFGEEGKGTRFAKMWACGLMAAIKNLQFLRTDCTTSKLSGDGSQQGVLPIRAEPCQERRLENDITSIKPHDLRTSVQAYGLGNVCQINERDS